MPALSPIPVFDLNAVAMIAARTRSLSAGLPSPTLILHECDFGVIPVHAFRLATAAPVAPNVQWVLVLTPHDEQRPSLNFGLFVENNQINSVGWVQDGDAPTAAEVDWWQTKLSAIAQDLADMSPVAPPDWTNQVRKTRLH